MKNLRVKKMTLAMTLAIAIGIFLCEGIARAESPPLDPRSVIMVAATAKNSSNVEYYFECTSGGGGDSGWQDKPIYIDTGLDFETEYCYKVKSREKLFLEETGWSEVLCATTQPEIHAALPPPGVVSPTPNPMAWESWPHEVQLGAGSFDYGASMTAIEATAAGGGGVEYSFQCTSNGNFSSGWQNSRTYTVLIGGSGHGYRFRVKARDASGNETEWSPEWPAFYYN